MFKKAGYLRSPLFYVAFFLIFFAVTEAIILFFDKQNFEALQRVFAIFGLLVIIVFDYWLREVKLANTTRIFVQILIALPLTIKFLYPYSSEFYNKIILDKTLYESNVIIKISQSKLEYIVFVWDCKFCNNMATKELSARTKKIDFAFDTTNIVMFKEKFSPDYFERLKYHYTMKDSSLLLGEIEINKNPDMVTSPYLIGKTKYNYHVFKIIYDSNNEPYLLQAINFETDKITMRKAIEQLNKDLQKN